MTWDRPTAIAVFTIITIIVVVAVFAIGIVGAVQQARKDRACACCDEDDGYIGSEWIEGCMRCSHPSDKHVNAGGELTTKEGESS
jgi:hypothetical protein